MVPFPSCPTYLEGLWSLQGKEEEMRATLAITLLSRRSAHPLPLGAESTSPLPVPPVASPHSGMGAGGVPWPSDDLGFSLLPLGTP